MKDGVGRSPSPNHSGTIEGSPKTAFATSPILEAGSASMAARTPCGRELRRTGGSTGRRASDKMTSSGADRLSSATVSHTLVGCPMTLEDHGKQIMKIAARNAKIGGRRDGARVGLTRRR